MFGDGTTRAVIVVGPIALKIARHRHGMRCNRFEADLYRRATASRHAALALISSLRCPLPISADIDLFYP